MFILAALYGVHAQCTVTYIHTHVDILIYSGDSMSSQALRELHGSFL
jgi:hypothetical protein